MPTTKCPDCYAHYTGKHECVGLMKMIVGEHKKRHPLGVQCGVKMLALTSVDELYYCANTFCPNYSLVAVRVSEK